MTLNKKLETRDTADKPLRKIWIMHLQLIKDIDKSTTAQNDFAEIFALRDS